MKRFRVSYLARRDLAEIRHYIRRDKPKVADKLIDAFFQRFRILAANPELGQLRGEFGSDIRLFSVGNYAIIYRPFTQGVEIVRVASGFRDLDALFPTP